MSGIKSMYVDSSACVRVNGDEREWFRINSGVRQGCIMSPWLFNVYMDEGGGDGDGKDRSEIPEEWDDLDDLQMTWFYVVSWRRT